MRQAAHGKHPALVRWRCFGSGDRICGHPPDSALSHSPRLPGFAGVPIDASPSMPVLLFAFVTSLVTGVAFGIAPAWMTTRVDPIEALRGAGRSTTRAGSLPRKTLVVFQAALSLVLLSASGLLTTAVAETGESRARVRPGPAHRGEHQSTACRLPSRSNSRRSTAASTIQSQAFRRLFRGSLSLLTARSAVVGVPASG